MARDGDTKLHLKGLESLVVSNGKLKLNVAVSRHEEKLRVRLWKDDKEADLLDAEKPVLDGGPHRRGRWQASQGVAAQGRPLRDDAAQGVPGGPPEIA